MLEGTGKQGSADRFRRARGTMIFTNAMLSALRDSLEQGYYDGLTAEEMQALLARLDKSEGSKPNAL